LTSQEGFGQRIKIDKEGLENVEARLFFRIEHILPSLRAEVHLVCLDGTETSWELMEEGDKKKFCNDIFEITLNDIEASAKIPIVNSEYSGTFTIKFNDPDCYSKSISNCESTQDCKICHRTSSFADEGSSERCCYTGQECQYCPEPEEIDMFACSGLTNSECKEMEEKGYCEYCEENIQFGEPATSCCVVGRCDEWTGSCSDLDCGEECLGKGDPGCPDQCPCIYGRDGYFCIDSRSKCESPNQCLTVCPSNRRLESYSCDDDRVCCEPELGLSVYPPEPGLNHIITIKYADTTGHVDIILKIKYPDGTEQYQGNPYMEQGDGLYFWSWFMRQDTDREENPLVAGEFELKETGEYTAEFWVNVKDGKPDGNPSLEVKKGEITFEVKGVG